jgi:hypothetical protein
VDDKVKAADKAGKQPASRAQDKLLSDARKEESTRFFSDLYIDTAVCKVIVRSFHA